MPAAWAVPFGSRHARPRRRPRSGRSRVPGRRSPCPPRLSNARSKAPESPPCACPTARPTAMRRWWRAARDGGSALVPGVMGQAGALAEALGDPLDGLADAVAERPLEDARPARPARRPPKRPVAGPGVGAPVGEVRHPGHAGGVRGRRSRGRAGTGLFQALDQGLEELPLEVGEFLGGGPGVERLPDVAVGVEHAVAARLVAWARDLERQRVRGPGLRPRRCGSGRGHADADGAGVGALGAGAEAGGWPTRVPPGVRSGWPRLLPGPGSRGRRTPGGRPPRRTRGRWPGP